MSQLTDMEELLNQVKNRELIPNLREAITCYYSSSFRACIILSFNSLVDDLIIKLKHTKDINNDAKRIYNDISKLIESQAPFENQLIEQLVKAKIFTELDSELYKVFQKFRHKSAHPSGFTPSAECARFIFSEIIMSFLSKEALQSTSKIDRLLSNIAEEHFFVDKTSINKMGKVVYSEIKDIHPDALPQLVNRVYKKFIDTEHSSRFSYRSFLFALAAIDKLHINKVILDYIIIPNINKADHEEFFTGLISSNSKIFDDIDEHLSDKVINQIKLRLKTTPKNIANFAVTNPYNSLLQIFEKCTGNLNSKSLDLMDEFFKKPARLCVLIRNIDKNENQKGRVAYLKCFEMLLAELLSDRNKSVDGLLHSFLNDDLSSLKSVAVFRRFEIFLAIVKNTSNSTIANQMINDKFEQLSYLRDGVREFYMEGDFNKKSLIHGLADNERHIVDTILGDSNKSE